MSKDVTSTDGDEALSISLRYQSIHPPNAEQAHPEMAPTEDPLLRYLESRGSGGFFFVPRRSVRCHVYREVPPSEQLLCIFIYFV
jgi:hypothetical protein